MKSSDYARGYYAGIRGRWPEHKPPFPPTPVLEEIFRKAVALRDEADTIQATFSPDDETGMRCAALVDEFDEAMEAVTKWLKEEPDEY